MKITILKIFLLFTLLNLNASIMAQKQNSENEETGYLQPAWEMQTKRYCMTLELKDDPELIQEYEAWHLPDKIWKEIPEGIRKAGILDSEIYRSGTTLFMILTVPADFDFVVQMGVLTGLPRQAEWENFMTKYQTSKPGSSSAEKWVKMKRVFKLP
jgi:L-rhamnose mutarotase